MSKSVVKQVMRPAILAGLVAGAAALGSTADRASADTLNQALALAYVNNPQLNSQRAIARQVDENVPQALSGYRPQVSATANLGSEYTYSVTRSNPNSSPALYSVVKGNNTPNGAGLAVKQTLFNGFQTANKTRAAESQVSASGETLRLMEQTVLLDAATAYMNMLRDTAILDLQRRNVEVLQEQLRQTRDRFQVGEVTRTDVAQAQSRLAAARSQLLVAQSNYTTSQAAYRRVIGIEPNRLAPGTPVDRLSPRKLDIAVAQGMAEHPSVTAAMYGVDVAALQVKIAEGALYPNLSFNGTVTQQNEAANLVTLRNFNAAAMGQLTIPIYQGGGEYSTIRQSKESLGQKRFDLDTTATRRARRSCSHGDSLKPRRLPSSPAPPR